MADSTSSRVARPSDDDSITPAPPASETEPEPPHRPSLPHQTVDVVTARNITQQATGPPTRPGLPHQTVGVATARNITQKGTEGPPPEPHPQATPQDTQGTQGTGANNNLENFDGIEEPHGNEGENYWRPLQLLILFWRNRRKRSPGNQRPAGGSRSDDRWRKFRTYFSRRSSPTPATGTQQAATPSGASNTGAVGGVGEAVEVGGINLAGTRATSVAEVDTILGQHRSKFSAGHEGQLRGPPNPNNPATPPRPIPRHVGRREELGNTLSRPSRPPPPPPSARPARPARACTETSNGSYSAGILPPSSRGENIRNPDDFFDGLSSSHTEDISSSRSIQDDPDNTPFEAESDDPRCPQNSPVNSTVPDGTKAHIERNDDVSDLLSEVRYPSHSSQSIDTITTGIRTSGTPQATAELLQGVSETIQTIEGGQNTLSVGGLLPSDLFPQNDRPERAVRVETGEVAETDSSDSNDDALPSDYEAEATYYNIESPQRSNYSSQSRLHTIDEEGEGNVNEMWNDVGRQEVPPDAITDPAVMVNLEDVENARSWVYESSEEEGVSRPRVDKGKGVDREAHPNYDCYVGYTRIRPNNDPGFEPGPSDWQHRPKLRDMPRDYDEDDDLLY